MVEAWGPGRVPSEEVQPARTRRMLQKPALRFGLPELSFDTPGNGEKHAPGSKAVPASRGSVRSSAGTATWSR